MLFNLVPKLHFLVHVALLLHQGLKAGGSILNPSVWSTPMAEDFVGRMCRMSVRVHPTVVSTRGTEKYLVKARRLAQSKAC